MLKGSCLLIIIYLTSMFYNYFISYLILLYLSNNIYNNIIISLIILIQIDNYILFVDYNNIKLEIDNLIKENKVLKENQNKINNKFLNKLNSNQLKPPKKYIKRYVNYN
jgi:hypothetical protein